MQFWYFIFDCILHWINLICITSNSPLRLCRSSEAFSCHHPSDMISITCDVQCCCANAAGNCMLSDMWNIQRRLQRSRRYLAVVIAARSSEKKKRNVTRIQTTELSDYTITVDCDTLDLVSSNRRRQLEFLLFSLAQPRCVTMNHKWGFKCCNQIISPHLLGTSRVAHFNHLIKKKANK